MRAQRYLNKKKGSTKMTKNIKVEIEFNSEPTEDAIIKAMAPKLASLLEWNGKLIMDLFQLTLEDANFHSLNEDIETIRKVHKI